MRPPKEKFISYTDIEWGEIKRVLVRVGVNADTVPVQGVPLRAELERQRVRYDELDDQKIPTTRQLSQVINEAIAAIIVCRDNFGPRDTATYYAGDDTAAEAREVLDRLEANLRSAVVTEGRDFPDIAQRGSEIVLEAGGGPDRNACKGARDRYWSNLGRIWMTIVLSPQPRRYLFNFVQACALDRASIPAIRSYFDRERASK